MGGRDRWPSRSRPSASRHTVRILSTSAGSAARTTATNDERREDILAQLDAFLTKDRDRALFPELAGDGRT